jgi:hypothetical protein
MSCCAHSSSTLHACISFCTTTAHFPRLYFLLHHHCSDCVIMSAVRQARIHTSTGCDFYLHTGSRPIIEHCTGLRFAPYTVRFDGDHMALLTAGLLQVGQPMPGSTPGSAGDMWRQVDDFGWHRVHASPNWSLLPQAEWISNAPAASGAADLSNDKRHLRPAAAALGVSIAEPPADPVLLLGATLAAAAVSSASSTAYQDEEL